MRGKFDLQQMASQSRLWGRVPGGDASPLGAVEFFRQPDDTNINPVGVFLVFINLLVFVVFILTVAFRLMNLW